MLKRKLFHFLGILVLAYIFIDKRIFTAISFTLMIIMFSFDYLRLKGLVKVPKSLMRKKENKQMLGTTWFFLGMFLTVVLFEKNIALISMTILVISDPLAEIFGRLYGERKIFMNKTYFGSFVFLLSSLIIALTYSNFYTLTYLQIISVALASTLAEIYSLFLDDNLTIPLISAIILSIV